MFLAIGQVLDTATFSVVYREFPIIVIAEVFPFVPLAIALGGLAAFWLVKGSITGLLVYAYPRAYRKARWVSPALVIVAASGYVGCFSNIVAYLTLRSMS
jgi:hypothetical protein